MKFAFEIQRESNPRGSKPPSHTVLDLDHSANRVYTIGTECSHHMPYEMGVCSRVGSIPSVSQMQNSSQIQSPMFPSHVMGTFGTNRIYSVGRMVKVADRMRWGFVPAQVRFPPYLKCKIRHSGTSSDTASTISNNENLEAESANWSGQHQPMMADALETLQTLPPTYD